MKGMKRSGLDINTSGKSERGKSTLFSKEYSF